MSAVIELTREDLERRRTELLGALERPVESFREDASNGVLSDAEWSIKEALDSVEFLLGALGDA
ncbi:hypothetical protein [Agromyces archimandritae]|uniref:Uncharacterized protein n=1 Tax=Agromyces archimandritae TaxID=2781962 RepID=A0A975FJ19_9MICO|nr:hypothetical protein [Agromyces archimandritae]QTX03390.1 hypothetical protein G127AT_08355 [Agromyces archimandritae]